MDYGKKKTDKANPNPFAQANFFSKIFFLWILPFMRKGSKVDMSFEDMYDVLPENEAGFLGDQLENEWKKQKLLSKKHGREPKLLNCICKIQGKFYLFLSSICILNECVIKVLQPIFLRWLIQSFDTDSLSSTTDRYLYASGLCATFFLYSIITHAHIFNFTRIGLKCRVALSALVYRKALHLNKNSLRHATTGHVVNLLATDVGRFDWNIFSPYLIAGPLQLAIYGYLLYRELGVSAFTGIGIILLLLPVQFVVFKYSKRIRTELCKRTDARASFMSEIIVGIRVIKMYAWEKPFSSLIHKLRELEVKYLTRLLYLQAFYKILYDAPGKIIILLTTITYILNGYSLTADTIFFCVAVVSTTLYANMFCIPVTISDIAAIRTSMKRLEKYLLLGEYQLNHKETIQKASLEPNDNMKTDSREEIETPSVIMKSLNASWTGEELTLQNMCVDLTGNKLVMVVGSVGAGKSSFLNTLISELSITSGTLELNGRLAYDSQDPWLFSATIKQNILFGRPYNEERYQQVIRVCGLEDDLKQFPAGNSTIVGERGISLSGGQKARINLARCLYQEADIYLLDDPLSAVDTQVSRHIFDKCIKSYLDGRLRILVTHQLQYLPNTDYVIVLKNGKILAQGSYEYLLTQNVDFVSLISSDSEEEKGLKRRESKAHDPNDPANSPEAVAKDEDPDFLEEQMAGGNVTFATFLEYFKASKSILLTVSFVFGCIFTQVIVNSSEYWLANWIRHEEDYYRDFSEQDSNSFNRNLYVYTYVGLISGVIFFGTLTAFGFHRYCMIISVNMHNAMFKNIVRAPTKFFDFNPSGRVMNRFTKDVSTIDEFLPGTVYDSAQTFVQTLGVMVIVCITNYFILIPTCFILIALVYTRQLFIGASRAVKRTEALSRSPLFTHLTATMQGLSTIRSSNSQEILRTQFESYQNTNSALLFLYLGSTRWFGSWLELESVLYLIAITFSFFLIPSATTGGNIGLAISSALVLNINLQWGLRQSAETENHMISVERIVEYSHLPAEAELDSSPEKKPPKTWPSSGEIKFVQVSLSYTDDNDNTTNENKSNEVLKNLSFDIKSQEKIGIVGRTGAGKSSILAALFRMTEPKGKIMIDEVCINDIGLHDLRQNISIIPQDPVVFSGTARYNLDPFDKYSDSELWMALEEVHLKSAIPSLDFTINDGGSNLSVGQRQLICLARAILRKNRVLVMDEATANVDPGTDELIQKTIRSKFATCTIITIAHRLHSVMDCDRILVLDNGCLMEYDHPHILLQNPDGILSSMVKQVGHHGGKILRQTANETYHGRRKSFDCNENKMLNGDSENSDSTSSSSTQSQLG